VLCFAPGSDDEQSQRSGGEEGWSLGDQGPWQGPVAADESVNPTQGAEVFVWLPASAHSGSAAGLCLQVFIVCIRGIL
jgi:hypothetical protein